MTQFAAAGWTVAVVVGSGDVVNRVGASEFHVPKRDLVGSLQLAFQLERLRVSMGTGAGGCAEG